ncbi:TPA: hypothetical protein ACN311_002378 [Vibrio parahaemolyticus]|nr:hypothetical protein [Vibrio vulnificus]
MSSNTNNSYSYSYQDMVCEDSKRATDNALKQENYSKNINSYYRQDSSDFKAVSKNNKSKAQLDEKYAKYSNKK